MNSTAPPSSVDIIGPLTDQEAVTEPLGLEAVEKNPRDEAIELFNMSDDEFEEVLPEFIKKRTSDLTEQDSGPDALYFESKGTDSFIGPKIKMVRSVFDKEFYLDDPKAYETLVRFTRSFYDKLILKGLPPERALYNAAIHGTYLGQASYFESYFGDLKALVAMVGDTVALEEPNLGATHVENLKKVAVCMERSGVAHNALKILGIDSRLEIGSLRKEEAGKDPGSGGHVFITFKNPQGERILYDPTNPIKVVDIKGDEVAYQPFTVKIPDEAEEVVVPLPTKTKGDDGSYRQSSSISAVYKFNN